MLLAALAGAYAFVASSAWMALAAAVDEHDTMPAQPLVEGRQVFDSKGCAQCHGVLEAPGTQRVGPDLARGRAWRDVMQLAGALWNQTPAMLEQMRARGVTRPDLSRDDVGKLTAYLLYSRFLDEPANAERGRDLFETRSCAQCHQLGGRGGTTGPRLDELAPQMSSLFMAQALWNHGPEMAVKMKELGVARPRLERRDVVDIVAYIRGPGRGVIAPQEIAAELGSPRAGQAVFAAKGCVKCHAIAGVGGTIGPDLAARRPLASVGEMAGAMWNHGPTMWLKMSSTGATFPRLSGPEMSDVLAYLYYVQYMDTRGDAAHGAEVFAAKSCASCHAPDAAGKRLAPDLTTSDALRSPLDWTSAMWRHAPAMADKVRDSGGPWPRFADDDMRDLVAFLRSSPAARR